MANGNSQNEKSNDVSSKEKMSKDEKKDIGNYLFNSDKMDIIEISGKDLLKRKEVEISTEIKVGKNVKLVIRRDNTGPGISMIILSGTLGVDMVNDLEKSLDEGCGAKEDFYYQMASYDFNHDGEKEIIVAGGNKKDILELRVFQLNTNLEYDNHNPKLLATINGGYKSYINDKDEICVINSNDDISVYSYKEIEQESP